MYELVVHANAASGLCRTPYRLYHLMLSVNPLCERDMPFKIAGKRAVVVTLCRISNSKP